MSKKEELSKLEFEHHTPPLLDSLYVIVSNKKHESGYKMYKIYGFAYKRDGNNYHKCLSECSDVIDFSALKGFAHLGVDSIETNLFRFFLSGNKKFKVLGRLSTFIVDIVEESEEDE